MSLPQVKQTRVEWDQRLQDTLGQAGEARTSAQQALESSQQQNSTTHHQLEELSVAHNAVCIIDCLAS